MDATHKTSKQDSKQTRQNVRGALESVSKREDNDKPLDSLKQYHPLMPISEPDQPISEDMTFQFLSLKVEADYGHSMAEFKELSDYVYTLMKGHLDKASWTEEHTFAFMKNLDMHKASMKSFALKTNFFKSLSKNDRLLLLENNLSLFGNFILAKYLTRDKATDQLSLIIGMPESAINRCQKKEKIGFHLLNQGRMGCLFPYYSSLMIQNYIESIRFTTAFTALEDSLGLLCQYFLFATNHWSQDIKDQLKEIGRIEAIYDESKKCVDYAIEVSSTDLDELVQKLHAICIHRTRHFNQSVEKCFPQNPYLTYEESK